MSKNPATPKAGPVIILGKKSTMKVPAHIIEQLPFLYTTPFDGADNAGQKSQAI